MQHRILIIEDEPGVRLALKDELEFEGFAVETAEDGEAGLAAILKSPPSLVVLDLMLPHRNGFNVCEAVRSHGLRTPIIVVTARIQEADKIRGLQLGADDYVTKPFSLAELVARIRAVLRRADTGAAVTQFEVCGIRIDLRRREASKAGLLLQLTDTEFRILAMLLERAGDVITREEFLKTIWGDEVYVTHRTVDTHMAALRKKIEDRPDHPAHIISVRNVGYRFNQNPA